ncbi:hypothetical protein MWQ89_001285 [Staphylococcus pseudintermedius]|nr:hypothetical protein [Staphylococcus pseudintermedius]
MAIQLEIIDGRLDSTQSIYNFETLVNSFLRTHTIIDVEYKTIERTIQQTNIKTVIQVAYITYDDNLDKTWEDISNDISEKQKGNVQITTTIITGIFGVIMAALGLAHYFF